MLIKRIKLLIAYDGSECADAALADLRRAGLPDADALVLSVEEPHLMSEIVNYEVVDSGFGELASPSKRPERIPVDAYALAVARSGAERLSKFFPSWDVRADSAEGPPAMAMVRRAEDWQPDLIVLGSHGRSALARMVLGSVSQKVLRDAQTSVRIARSCESGRSSIRVLVGVDGSLSSLAGVREVARRVWPPESEALVVAVEDPLVPTAVGSLIPPVTTWIKENNRSEGEWLRKVLDNAVADLRAAEMITSVSVLTGDPKHVLVEEAKRLKADSIFVGSVGFSNRVERLLLGSVSAAVAARAHCTVEVVRQKKASG